MMLISCIFRNSTSSASAYLSRGILLREFLLCSSRSTFIGSDNQNKRSIFTSGILLGKKREVVKEDEDRNPYTKKRVLPTVSIWRNITVKELATALNKPVAHVFEVMLYVKNTDSYHKASSQIDDLKIIQEIVRKSGCKSNTIAPPGTKDEEPRLDKDVESSPVRESELAPRPPVVTIMGHVDHGKTTLLDNLRNSNIVAGEAGGITQAIGAFQVKLDENLVTFLDTPGHAAFYAMRNRGAQATDIVVLVIAADDGCMEQTRESISMAQNANVPIIVAINKIDRGDADVERTKKSILQEGLQLEDFGGEVQAVPISALKGTNIEQLIECILLQAEFMNLRSENTGLVEGVVLESKVDSGRGKTSTALIQRGMLRKSSFLVAGTCWAKVRGMFDEYGQIVDKAGPSTPVEIIGWKELPSAGDKIFEVESEHRAKEIVLYRESLEASEKEEKDSEVIKMKSDQHMKEYKEALEKKHRTGYRYKLRRKGPRPKEIIDDDLTPRVNIIVKGDVDGSVESLLDVIETYDCHDQCRLDIVSYGVGNINENDINLADAFSAFIYAFNVNISSKLEVECKKRKIQFRHSKIIYRLVEALKKDINAKLPLLDQEEKLGQAEILQIFKINDGKKKIPVAGCRCSKGSLKKKARFKVIRGGDENVVYDGRVNSLHHYKDEVETVKDGQDCGVQLKIKDSDNFEPLPGDTLVCYHTVKVTQTTSWSPIGF